VDIGTVIGILSGLGLISLAIVQGGGASTFINIPSLMITVGGMLAATLINYPLPQVVGVMKVVQKAFFHKKASPEEVINHLVRFAEKARRDGVLALEQESQNVDDSFLQKGIQLAVDGTSPDLVREIMDTDLAFVEERHSTGQALFRSMGEYAPAFGMIGTLIGLIQMLRSLDDPSGIGVGMATALVTTFYGAFTANLICLPIAGKLKSRSEGEMLYKRITVEGVLSIQAGENPRIVEEKLKAFLSPQMRESVGRDKG